MSSSFDSYFDLIFQLFKSTNLRNFSTVFLALVGVITGCSATDFDFSKTIPLPLLHRLLMDPIGLLPLTHLFFELMHFRIQWTKQKSTKVFLSSTSG